MADAPRDAQHADEQTRELYAADTDMTALRRALLKAESVRHRDGWDQHALFGPIESSTSYGYRLLLWPDVNRLLNRHGNPANALVELADYSGTVAAMVARLRYPEFRGLYFMAEGWRVELPKDSPLADQKYDLAMADEHLLHEHPRRIKSRAVYAVTVDGAIWIVDRRRGKKPICFNDRTVPGLVEVDGRIPNALLKLTFELRTLFWNDIPERELL